jgi:hypothetical protein
LRRVCSWSKTLCARKIRLNAQSETFCFIVTYLYYMMRHCMIFFFFFLMQHQKPVNIVKTWWLLLQ